MSGYAFCAAAPSASTSELVSQIPKTLLSDIGKPERVSIRGTPQNGYIISAGDDLKLMILDNVSVAYLNVSAERINMPRDERAVIWTRGQIEKDILRIPPLPTKPTPSITANRSRTL